MTRRDDDPTRPRMAALPLTLLPCHEPAALAEASGWIQRVWNRDGFDQPCVEE